MFDLAIIGAGPAGLAAAIEATDLGLSIVLLDEQASPGGQVFRGVEAAATDPALAADLAEGARLVAAFRNCGADYRPSTTLWHLDADAGLLSVAAQSADQITARRILLATGAQERPMPIPGWTLPGVMSAGAAQIMLKTAGAVPSGAAIIAGQGPLVWLLAVQLLRAGAGPLTLLETAHRPVVPGLTDLWTGRALFAKGLGLIREARRRGLRVVPRVTALRAEGDGKLERVKWNGGELPCDLLLLHDGVIPSTHVTQAIGLAHDWDPAQQSWRPRLDSWGGSSHPNVAVAGDGGGIGGWEAAVAAGKLAALDAACRLGRIDLPTRDRRAHAPLRDRRKALALRPWLDRLYPPSAAPPEDATLVCRCEEITAGQVRAAARLGATGPNQAKAYLRAGMGACQGRMCGPTVAALIAATRGIPIPEAGVLRPRAPYKPITVGMLAASE